MRSNAVFTRAINIILGVWLFFSAFALPHGDTQQINTAISGILCVIFAVIALRTPETRYLNTILAIWLFVSSWALESGDLVTIWNNALVAVAIFVISLLPGHEARGIPPSPAR